MKWWRIRVCLCLWGALCALPGWALDDDLATEQMIAEARQWVTRGREDLAAEVWTRLLATRPQHPMALVQLGLIQARAGRLDAARGLLERAQRLPKPPADLDTLKRALAPSQSGAANAVAANSPAPAPAPQPPARKIADEAVSRPVAESPSPSRSRQAQAPKEPDKPERIARSAEKKGSASKAESDQVATTSKRREAPPKTSSRESAAAEAPPAPDTARARTSATGPGRSEDRSASARAAAATDPLAELKSGSAVEERWGDTRQKLEQLVRAQPNDPRYLQALAVHLTHREASRREGVRLLDSLTQRGVASPEARQAWRQALLSLSPRQGDDKLFASYLARYTDVDVAARARMLQASETRPATTRLLESRTHESGATEAGLAPAGKSVATW